jgi:hypothetical protein
LALFEVALCASVAYLRDVRVSRRKALVSLMPWTLTAAWFIYNWSGGPAWTMILPLAALIVWFGWRRDRLPWFLASRDPSFLAHIQAT